MKRHLLVFLVFVIGIGLLAGSCGSSTTTPSTPTPQTPAPVTHSVEFSAWLDEVHIGRGDTGSVSIVVDGVTLPLTSVTSPDPTCPTCPPSILSETATAQLTLTTHTVLFNLNNTSGAPVGFVSGSNVVLSSITQIQGPTLTLGGPCAVTPASAPNSATCVWTGYPGFSLFTGTVGLSFVVN
jgi:hypothetical protein